MYKYSIGYGMFDGGETIDLLHEQKFTHDEITEMVTEALAYMVEKVTKSEPKLYEHMFRVYNLWDSYHLGDISVADYLITEFGFIQDTTDVLWNIDGMDLVLNGESHEMKLVRQHLKNKNVVLDKLKIE